MSECVHNNSSSVCQTLDELDFERGIWYAAQYNDLPRIQQLIKKNKNVNTEDKAGYTALHYASRNGHYEICKLLISNGANVNALTKNGKATSLHRCASMGHVNIFKLLIQSGALLNLKDADGKTVLHRAVENGCVNIVEEILKIDPSLQDETDNTGKLPKDYFNISKIINDLFDNYKNYSK